MDDHKLSTKIALGLLPDWVNEILLKEKNNLIEEYCMYPDYYYDPHKYSRVQPFLFFFKGVPFHYLPRQQIIYDNWQVVYSGNKFCIKRIYQPKNEFYYFCIRAFRFYFKRIMKNLIENRISEAAKFTGSFIHTLQDFCSNLHCLENPEGSDIFVLDRLIKPHGYDKYMTPSMILAKEYPFFLNIRKYRPFLLGTTQPEAIFHLYSRLVSKITRIRFYLIPLVEGVYRNKKKQIQKNQSFIILEGAKLVADVLYTIFSLTFNRFKKNQVDVLKKIHLEEISPIEKPYILSYPYRFTPIVNNFCLDMDRRFVPLQLKFPDGTVKTFRHGFGTGCHIEYDLVYDIPKNVFKNFQGNVGLHPILGKNGKIKVEISLNNKVFYHNEFGERKLADIFDVPILCGGKLKLTVRDRTGCWGSPDNNVVWAEPILIKNVV